MTMHDTMKLIAALDPSGRFFDLDKALREISRSTEYDGVAHRLATVSHTGELLPDSCSSKFRFMVGTSGTSCSMEQAREFARHLSEALVIAETLTALFDGWEYNHDDEHDGIPRNFGHRTAPKLGPVSDTGLFLGPTLTCHKCRRQTPAPHKGAGDRGTAPCPFCGADEVYL